MIWICIVGDIFIRKIENELGLGSRKCLVRHEKVLTRVETVKMNLWNFMKKCFPGVKVTLELRFIKKTGPGYGHPPKLSRVQ